MTEPPQGDKEHPPSQWMCGDHPGKGWVLNDPFTISYYRLPIPDPSTGNLIITPFIYYNIHPDYSEVYATFGKGYPIHHHILQVIPVDYTCPPCYNSILCLPYLDRPHFFFMNPQCHHDITMTSSPNYDITMTSLLHYDLIHLPMTSSSEHYKYSSIQPL